MPKIQISEQLFYSLLGYTPTFTTLENQLSCIKAEISEPADKNGMLTIELNDTNRPDLWSVAGISRQLTTYKNTKSLSQQSTTPQYNFFETNPDTNKKIIVDKALQTVRPYVLAFTIGGKKIDNTLLLELIQIQEKLCENYGQHRQAVSVGIYREQFISWPVYYSLADPTTTEFVPLDTEKTLNLHAILETHPTGKKYAHLLSKFSRYPLLQDSKKQILSLVPIINSAFLGAIEIGDDRLLIECTGSNLEQLMLTMNIFACDCTDLGFEVTRVQSEYPYALDNNIIASFSTNQSTLSTHTLLTTPLKFQAPLQVSLKNISTMLGTDISLSEIQLALLKMGVSSKQIPDKSQDIGVEIEVPPYRNDFLHSVDIIEDVMIGLGLDFFKAEYPKNFTIGRLTDIEYLSRQVINIMVGLGFQEMIFPYLGSAEEFIKKMYAEKDRAMAQEEMIQVSNPISENYEFVRSSVLSNLLESERVSAHSPYPHRICELGKVVIKNNTENYGSQTNTNMGFLIADSTIGFTDINSILAAIFYYINIEKWHLELLHDSRFIEGRSGKIMRTMPKGQCVQVGVFGEIHPRVLDNFNITMPCVAGEIRLEGLQ